MPLGVAHIVLLEKTWTNFAEKLKLPNTRIYAAPKLDEALEAMRALVIPFTVYQPDPPLLLKT